MEELKQLSKIERFICTIGFPIVAFFTMVYVCCVIVNQNTEAINNLSAKLEGFIYAQKIVQDNPNNIINR